MQIAPVPCEFDTIRIRRTGGILGVDESLTVNSALEAKVTDRMRGDRAFTLDALASQELVQALKTLVEKNPAASDRRGADLFHYDIELSSGGRTYRFSSVDLGADEALHGVMFAANRIIDSAGSELPHVMRMDIEG